MKIADRLRHALESIGASLDAQDDRSLICDAPDGYVWTATGATTLTIVVANKSQTFFTAAVMDALHDLKNGCDRVTDPKEIAEIRHVLGDDSWGSGSGPSRIVWPGLGVENSRLPGAARPK